MTNQSAGFFGILVAMKNLSYTNLDGSEEAILKGAFSEKSADFNSTIYSFRDPPGSLFLP